MRSRSRRALSARRYRQGESLEQRLAPAGAPVILSEFMAENQSTLQDVDLAYSDWIELENVSTEPVNLAGWGLSDDAADLHQWELPGVTLAAGERLVVFASGKDRAVAGQELHTNFQLDAAGEFLALTPPEDDAPATSFAPVYPAQLADVSFGFFVQTAEPASLVDEGTPASFAVGAETLANAWTSATFDDSAWVNGPQGVGYAPEEGGALVTSIVESGTLANTRPAQVAANPFGEDQFAFVDRGHQHNGAAYNSASGQLSTIGDVVVPLPSYLVGQTYLELANDNRSAANYELTINTSRAAVAYLLIDNRLNGPAGSASDSSLDPPILGGTLQWVVDDGWEMVSTGLFPNGQADFTGVDEGGSGGASVNDRIPPGTLGAGNGVNQFYTVYRRTVANNSITLHQQAIGTSNMYSVVIADASETSLAPAVGLDVEAQLRGANASGYVRLPFSFDGLPEIDDLRLSVRYDAGFVAYLNGVEVARRNAPAVAAWNSAATAERANAAALLYEEIDVTAFAHLLLDQDTNVLAFHGLNSAAGDSDFLIDARLIATPGAALIQQYFTTPTAGQANVAGTLGFVEDTKFSVDRGFFTEPFQVEISTATAGAEIRYTLDGTRPTAATGLVYSGPLNISDTTTLRAAAFKPGYLGTNIDTQTYLFLDSVLQQDGSGLTNFANWGHAGPDWAVDPDIVNHADPNNRLSTSDLRTVPTVSLVMPWLDWFGGVRGSNGIYIQGSGIEKAASVEWILPSGESAFQIDASVQIQGGTSDDRWKDDKLSMRLKFKEPYGPTKLDYPVFEGAVDSFDTLILDGVLNYSWVHSRDAAQRAAAKYIQDQYVADLQNAMGGQAPHGRAVQLYLNGLYWGMYIAHERPDETFASDYLGGDKDDYDVMKHRPSTAVNGTTENYAALLALARQNLAVEANYQNLAAKLDLPAFADYMLLNFFVGNTDWAHQNWYASYNRVAADGKWRFHSWDAEHVLKSATENVLGKNDSGGPTEIHQRLLANPEYRVLFGDRVRAHLFNGGTLTAANAQAMYQARMTEVDRAIVGESARWGDNSETVPRTRANWLATQQQLLTNYFPVRTTNVLNQLRTAGLYSTLDAPSFGQHGGVVAPNFPLAMTGPNGATIYYTLDGSDPRLPGGQLNPDAVAYSGAVPLAATGVVKARAFSAGQWSAMNEATFVVGQPTLAIVEVNYHPRPATAEEPQLDDGEFEFVELLNTGNVPVSLYGVHLTGVEFDFGPDAGAQLAPGQRAVLVKNAAAFAARYGAEVEIAGTFTGSLSNGGETLTLFDALGGVVQTLSYEDGGDWPDRPDGDGSSLEAINPLGDLADPFNWRASSEFGGTPGAAGAGRRSDVVVNEVRARSDGGMLDAIELYNTTNQAIDVSGWLLSDSKSDYAKFVLPAGTMIAAGGYRVFDEDDFNPTPGVGQSFALDGLRGEDVWLLAAEEGRPRQFVDHVEFPATPGGVSLGRWPDSAGLLFPMTANTFGGANAGPVLGAVVVSEIMYDPTPEADDEAFEYVELYHRGGASIDLGGWSLAGGVDFVLPAGTQLASGEALTLVQFDPLDSLAAGAFRTRYGLTDDARLIGPYGGRLNNGGELLQLLRPDVPSPSEPDYIPLVLVDQVEYDDDAPWPSDPKGAGESLHRVAADAFGGVVTSWEADAPNPGATNFTSPVPGDTNGDGRVDLVDLNNVRNFFGAVGAGVTGDTNGDGRVDLVDLNAVRNNFGAGGAPLRLSASISALRERFTAPTDPAKIARHQATDAVFALLARESDPTVAKSGAARGRFRGPRA